MINLNNSDGTEDYLEKLNNSLSQKGVCFKMELLFSMITIKK